jgi:hypothetical protein
VFAQHNSIVILTEREPEKEKIRMTAYDDDVQTSLGLSPDVVSRERTTKMVKERNSGHGYNSGVDEREMPSNRHHHGRDFCQSRYDS